MSRNDLGKAVILFLAAMLLVRYDDDCIDIGIGAGVPLYDGTVLFIKYSFNFSIDCS